MVTDFRVVYYHSNMSHDAIVLIRRCPFKGTQQRIIIEDSIDNSYNRGVERAEEIASFFGKELEFEYPVHDNF